MPESPRVALFVTCLVDLIRPQVGFAAVKLLEDAGCSVEVPDAQTCCGQPAWNSGDRESAKALARQAIAAFEGYDYVVVPSGSCGATIAKDYVQMFEPGDPWADRARALGARLLLAEGVIHVEQPRKAIEAIEAHLALRQDPLRLGALHLMTTLTGSALLAIAVEAGEIDAETAWSAAHVDEDWQAEQWGQDSEAMARRTCRKRDMMAAAQLLEALER
jgi:chaperone required for assembly of F1-ATPase